MPTLNELGGKLKAKYPGSYDHLTDLEAGRRLRAKHPDAYLNYTGADTNRVTIRAHERGKPVRAQKSESVLTKMLPAAGGMVGGLVGGAGGTVAGFGVGGIPGAVGGAAVGGAGGEALRQLILDAQGQGPESSGEAAKRIGIEGGAQGLSELTGHGLGYVAKATGKAAMGMAMKFTPRVAQTAIDEGISATRWGVAKLFRRIKEIGISTRRIAGSGKGYLHTPTIASEIEAAVNEELGKSSTKLADPQVIRKVRSMRGQMIDQNPSLLPLSKALVYKKSASQAAAPQFDRLKTGELMAKATDPIEQLWKLKEAQILGEHLERALPDAYANLNARQSRLLALKDELVGPVNKAPGAGASFLRGVTSPLSRAAGGALVGEEAGRHHITPGGPIAGAIGGGVLGSPAGASVIGLLLNNPKLLAAVRQSPRVFAALMQLTQQSQAGGQPEPSQAPSAPPAESPVAPDTTAVAPAMSPEDTTAFFQQMLDEAAAGPEILSFGKGHHPKTPLKDTAGARARRLYGSR